MDKNLLRKYVNLVDKNMINNFALRNKVELSNHELDVIYNSIKNDYDKLINSDFYKYIEKYKNELSEKVYNKIIELYEKYKGYLK